MPIAGLLETNTTLKCLLFSDTDKAFYSPWQRLFYPIYAAEACT
jgi:hypothetical protein